MTQEQLRRYRFLKQKADAFARELEAEKGALLLAYMSGPVAGDVEPGEFGVRVEVRESRSFSYDALVDIIGRRVTDFIKGLLPAKSSTVLTVTGP